jgi:hypothetical protein
LQRGKPLRVAVPGQALWCHNVVIGGDDIRAGGNKRTMGGNHPFGLIHHYLG